MIQVCSNFANTLVHPLFFFFEILSYFGISGVYLGNIFGEYFWGISGIYLGYILGNILGGYLASLGKDLSVRFFGSSRIDRSPFGELSFVAGLLFKMMVDG